jgi:hypothetical protein
MYLNTLKTNQNTNLPLEITDKIDSLMQSSVFSSGDNTCDLKLQALWVDRSKR